TVTTSSNQKLCPSSYRRDQSRTAPSTTYAAATRALRRPSLSAPCRMDDPDIDLVSAGVLLEAVSPGAGTPGTGEGHGGQEIRLVDVDGSADRRAGRGRLHGRPDRHDRPSEVELEVVRVRNVREHGRGGGHQRLDRQGGLSR